jgi:hypothetical protein
VGTASSDGPAGSSHAGNQEVGQRDDSESPAIYGVNERRKDLDNNLAIQRSAVVAEEDRPDRVARPVRSRLAVGGSPCWLNSNTHNTIG